MAIANNLGYPTLVDKAKDEQSDMARALIDTMVERNAVLAHIPMETADEGDTFTTDYVTAYPDAVWMRLNAGITPSLDAVDTVTFTSGFMESMWMADARIINRGKRYAGIARRNRSAARNMANDIASTLWYGDESNPGFTSNRSVAGFTGIQHYVNDKGTGIRNDEYIIDASAAEFSLNATATAKNESSNTYRSIYLIGWGPDTVTGFVPEGVASGLQIMDPGNGGSYWVPNAPRNTDLTKKDAHMEVYSRVFRQSIGLAVPDWRYIVRIANIPLNLLKYDGKTGPNLIRALNVAADVRYAPDARWMGYCAKDVMPFIDTQAVESVRSSTLTRSDAMGDGIMRLTVQGDIPLFITDSLKVDEGFVD